MSGYTRAYHDRNVPLFEEWADLVERSDGDRSEIRKSERSVRPAPTVAHSVPRMRVTP